jgi:DNA repair protein RecO (recombination protein O)
MATSRAARAPALLSAYVLHRYHWSESSVILDLFTREQGRLAVVAKGAKRPYSQLRPILLPFQKVNVSLVKPRGAGAGNDADPAGSEVQTLRSAEWAGGAPMFGGAALFSGFYLNELLMKLLARHDPHERLWDTYAETLPALTSPSDEVVESALRAFELSLLKEIGLLPDLSISTLTLQPLGNAARYSLLPEAGVIDARSGEPSMDGSVFTGLEAALEHGSVAALQHACSRALPELKVSLRGLLHYHLGSPVLRTRQVMLQMHKP